MIIKVKLFAFESVPATCASNVSELVQSDFFPAAAAGSNGSKVIEAPKKFVFKSIKNSAV